MNLFKRFWGPIVISILLVAATFIVQATKSSAFSSFLIEWAGVWPTFIAALAALLIVGMAFFTYLEERKIKRLKTKDILQSFSVDALLVWYKLNSESNDSGPLTLTERGILLQPLETTTKEATKISTLAEIFGGKMKTHIDAILESLAEMELLLINSRVVTKAELLNKMKDVPSLMEKVIRYEIL